MKVSLSQLLMSADIQQNNENQMGALSRLSRVEMPIASSFSLKGIIGQVNKYLDQFREEVLDLYKKHGTYNAKSDSWVVDNPSKKKVFSADYTELISIQVDIAGNLLKASDFSPTSQISADDLIILSWLIEDETDKIEVKPFVFRDKALPA